MKKKRVILKVRKETIRQLSDLRAVAGGIPGRTEAETCFPSGIHTCAPTCPMPTFAPCPRPL